MRWRDIQKELPPLEEAVFTDSDCGSVAALCDTTQACYGKPLHFHNEEGITIYSVRYWMPIEEIFECCPLPRSEDEQK